MDDSSSMNKINSGNAKTMIAGFFSHKFPLKGWPFPKYPPFPMVNPNIATNPSGAQEESAKLPSSPSKDNKDGRNAWRLEFTYLYGFYIGSNKKCTFNN